MNTGRFRPDAQRKTAIPPNQCGGDHRVRIMPARRLKFVSNGASANGFIMVRKYHHSFDRTSFLYVKTKHNYNTGRISPDNNRMKSDNQNAPDVVWNNSKIKPDGKNHLGKISSRCTKQKTPEYGTETAGSTDLGFNVENCQRNIQNRWICAGVLNGRPA